MDDPIDNKQPDDKQQLRLRALETRRAQPPEARHNASLAIQNSLLALIGSMDADGHPLLTYRSMNSEVETDCLFSAPARRTFAPVTHERGHMQWHEVTADTIWERGAFDVPEPKNGTQWEPDGGRGILACPLVAFDRNGNRLGLGKGCFDLWLSHFRADIFAVIGLAFACQEVAKIPTEAHDIPMDYIITENEVIACQTS